MFHGTLEAIFIGPAKAGPMQQVETAEVEAGSGLVGNRYSRGGKCIAKGAAPKPLQQITLIEAEALEAAARDYDAMLEPIQSRRNLLVRGVPLNHLVDKEFTVGPIRLRGIMLCEPCSHLEKLTIPGIEKALLHRGGLRAEVLTSGTLHAGDAVQPV